MLTAIGAARYPFPTLRDKELSTILSCEELELEFCFDDVEERYGRTLTGKDEVDPLGLGTGDTFGDSEGEGVLLRERRGKGNS